MYTTHVHNMYPGAGALSLNITRRIVCSTFQSRRSPSTNSKLIDVKTCIIYFRKYGRNHKKSLHFVIVIHIVLHSNHQAYYAKITQRFALHKTEHFSSVICIANMSRAII